MSKYKILWNAFVGVLSPRSSAFEKVSDYVLGAIIEWLNESGFVQSAASYQDKIAAALRVLSALSVFCPAKWVAAYNVTLRVFESLLDAIEDAQVTEDEIASVRERVFTAYDAWMAE